jgi:cell division septum initiation protein DivIVA
MSASKLPPERRKPGSVDEAAERLAAIVEAAERAASAVIDDAERAASSVIDDAQDRADRIVADRLRTLADELDPPRGADPPRLRPVESRPEPEPAAPERLTPRRTEEAGARLLATQMAVSGASREEIGDRLRTDCGIDDPGPLLDAILGPGE